MSEDGYILTTYKNRSGHKRISKKAKRLFRAA